MNSLRWCCPRVPVLNPQIGVPLGNNPGGASDGKHRDARSWWRDAACAGMRPEASRDRCTTPLKSVAIKGACVRRARGGERLLYLERPRTNADVEARYPAEGGLGYTPRFAQASLDSLAHCRRTDPATV